ncbi:MAG: NAD(P)H-binding protein [Streptomycetaceae bacterium]|nr:NAD(P)H-binding protein [Streptomycetaceae bacterium]
MTVLVTGSRGAVARGLMALLHTAAIPYRAASAKPSDSGTVRLDLTDPSTFPAALAAVRSVFLYAGAEHIDAFISDAVAAGVEHVVLLSSSSVRSPDADASAIAKTHLDVENALTASPLPSTLLRPGAFASNAGAWAWAITSGRPVSLPYPDAHSDPIHERDIAEAAFAVLTDTTLSGRAYTLTGPQSLTFAEQLATLSGVIGRDIPTRHVTRDEWKAEVGGHMPPAYADALLDYWQSNDTKPVPLTDSVHDLTGHAPRDFATWATDHKARFST